VIDDPHAKLRAALADELPAAVALRRRLHMDPRVSGAEDDTADTIIAELAGGSARRVAGTGRIVTFDGAPAPFADANDGVIALRAELDALPVAERTGVGWASANGAMHACGHDVHLAALVAACRAIKAVGADRPLVALLQPREEGSPSGAADVVASGALAELGVRSVVAAHVQPRLPAGTVAATPGPVNAATDEFTVIVSGRGGHAGYPHTTRDPVLALCQTVVSLQQVVSRRFDPVVGAVCSVGRLSAGNAANVVPDTATARGSLRVMRDADRDLAIALISEIVEHTAAAHGCVGEVTIEPCEPVLDNDPALAHAAAPLLAAAGLDVEHGFRSFGADDFSHYCHAARGLMLFVGTATGDPDTAPGLHSAGFLPPDDTVATVAEALLAGYLAATVA
jgi:amidohydrolase